MDSNQKLPAGRLPGHRGHRRACRRRPGGGEVPAAARAPAGGRGGGASRAGGRRRCARFYYRGGCGNSSSRLPSRQLVTVTVGCVAGIDSESPHGNSGRKNKERDCERVG